VLGSGGMGTVHAAFDPELERRVAVKVLHARDTEARARLLREARAMAKLSHANVITVFEVGSADGNDFVAMELVDGETLKEWWTRTRPKWRDVVAAFIAAGRGLAAAHAAGLVHRDFKPSNVLRSKGGKIVVTDFGLSRAASDEDELVAAAAVPGVSASSPLRTQTGVVLGTPAYMSPEQWTGGNAGTASDQYAFCVALWEALAGKRPHHGDTIDDLKRAALAGPDPDAADALPREVRTIVRRGLASDPAARWPSMDALLDALERAILRRRRLVGLAAALAVGGIGTAALLLVPRGQSGDDCATSGPDRTWTPARVAVIRGKSAAAADLLDGDIATWRSARAHACTGDAALRATRLACLDSVMARFEVAASLVERGGTPHGLEGTSSLLVDPAMCERTPVPHLTAVIDDQLAGALALFHDARDGLDVTAAKIAPPSAPCARAVGQRSRMIATDNSQLEMPGLQLLAASFKEIKELAPRCDDLALQAMLRIGLANGAHGELDPAVQAVAALPQVDLVADLDLARAGEARRGGQFDLAIATLEKANAGFAQRKRTHAQLRATLDIIETLFARGTPADIAKIRAIVADWRPRAKGLHAYDLPALELADAEARWRLGEVAAADDVAIAIGHIPSSAVQFTPKPLVDVAGRVVDEAGDPVPDAEIVAGPGFLADSAHAAAPLDLHRAVRTRSDRDGRFTLPHARGMIVADAGARRSEVVEVARHVTLTVHKTFTIGGRVELGAHSATQIRVIAEGGPGDLDYGGTAPVRPDGTFELRGVPPGKLGIAAAPYDVMPIDRMQLTVTKDTSGITLVAHDARPLHVIARNTGMVTPDAALVFVFSGHAPKPHSTLADLKDKYIAELEASPVSGVAAPATVRDRIQNDDLFVTMSARPPGPLFVCTVGFTRDLFAHVKSQKDLGLAMVQAELGCADVSPTDDAVVVEVPPVRKPG